MGRKLTRLNICEGTLFAAAGSTRMVWLQQPSKQANLQREIQHAPDLPMHHSVDRIFAQWYCLRVSKSNPAPLTHPPGARGRLRGGRRGARNRTGFIQSGGWAMMSLVLGGSTVRTTFPCWEWTRACVIWRMHQLLSAGCKWGVRRCYMPGLILMAKRKGSR